MTTCRYYLSDVLTGRRKFVRRTQAQKAYCPHIDGKASSDLTNIFDALGLRMEQLLAFIKERPQLLEYLPEEAELPKAGKEWIANMLQTLCQQEFQALVRHAEQARRDKSDLRDKRNVSRHWY